MLEALVFQACMLMRPPHAFLCHEERLKYEGVPLHVCNSGAQIPLSQWRGNHPKWVIRSWTCEPKKSGEQI